MTDYKLCIRFEVQNNISRMTNLLEEDILRFFWAELCATKGEEFLIIYPLCRRTMSGMHMEKL